MIRKLTINTLGLPFAEVGDLRLLFCSLAYMQGVRQEGWVRFTEGTETDFVSGAFDLNKDGEKVHILPERTATSNYQRYQLLNGPLVEIRFTQDWSSLISLTISSEFMAANILECTLDGMVESHYAPILTLCKNVLELLIECKGSEKFYARADWYIPVVLTTQDEQGKEEIAERVNLTWLVKYLEKFTGSKGVLGVPDAWLTKVQAKEVPTGEGEDVERASVLVPPLVQKT
ncbi:hypothetical protein BH11PAT4_BH11PAT4_6260 [soil metagenome]